MDAMLYNMHTIIGCILVIGFKIIGNAFDEAFFLLIVEDNYADTIFFDGETTYVIKFAAIPNLIVARLFVKISEWYLNCAEAFPGIDIILCGYLILKLGYPEQEIDHCADAQSEHRQQCHNTM